MWSSSDFRDLVSGRRRGPRAALLRGALAAVEVPYAWAVRVRNRRYDRVSTTVHRAGVPVISIGNLTLGGTGKTPLVAWTARWFRERGVRVAIVSRGYGAEAGARNDEALELELQLPDVPHVQDRDRVAAAGVAIEELDCQLILLDDGFQHRRLHRDLDVVLLDALEPLGFGHVFPRGTLREPLAGLARADVVVLSRADLIEPRERAQLRQQVARYAPGAAWCEAVHAPQHLLDRDGNCASLDVLQAARVAAFCGIGNPPAFWRTLEALGCHPVAQREFPDHYLYQREDIVDLTQWSSQHGADLVVCTRKDLVKLRLLMLGSIPLRAVAIEQSFRAGQDQFEQRLASIADPIT
ncbi:MAG: tetraacyldisaccharide 4'-kinase [Pirellulales bacterium]